jgi:hypothetical protein
MLHARGSEFTLKHKHFWLTDWGVKLWMLKDIKPDLKRASAITQHMAMNAYTSP